MKSIGIITVVGLAMSWGGLVSGCAYDTEDLQGAENIDTVEQALTNATVKYLRVSAGGPTTLSCPSSRPQVLGSGHWGDGGMIRANVDASNSGTTWAATSSSSSGLQIACSNAWTRNTSRSSGSGDVTVYCPAGETAVGGGGSCASPNGRLYRSRPNPDADESEPTGWRASCTTGGVTATVNCVNKDWYPAFRDCRTERKDGNGGYAQAACDSGDHAVAGGAWCGDGYYIRDAFITTDNLSVFGSCRGDAVHTYAICCDNINVDD